MSVNAASDGEAPPGWGEGPPVDFKLIGKIAVISAAVISIIVLLFAAKGIYTDWLWYDNLGFVSVFKKILFMRIWLFFGGALVAAAFLIVNLYIAYRFSRGESVLPAPPEVIKLGRVGIILGASLVVLVTSVVFGFVAQGRWETFLIYFNKVSFGVEDPQFNKDMIFYVATMPMLHFVQGWFMGLAIAMLVTAAALYVAVFSLRGIKFVITPRLRAHIAILGAVLMITIALAHYLDIFELVFSGRGAAPGAGFTDVNARIPALWLLIAIALVSAVGLVVSIKYGGLRLMVASFTLWAVLAIMAGAIYPVGFQRVRVKPNEFAREEKFIDRAIVSTRAAYGLDQVVEKPFNYQPILDADTINHNPETINNIRLWDHRPLRDTYNQIQTFRQYYNFVGVDVDRYRFPGGEFRQVMLSARELFPENLEEGAQNWVNRTLSYTHGFGVAMSPVNRMTREGRPEFFLQDVPPKGRAELQVDQPEIYYGENTKGFVIVKSKTNEFNFPGPEGTPNFKDYEGEGGVGIGSFLRKAAYAWQFLDFNILISGEITSDSRVQYRREIHKRVSTIAPFLRLDDDPYLVLGAAGKLWWIQDAYTTTDRYAYSQRFMDEFNYIRNSVKVVIDAYNGTVHFFVIDPEDPIIQIYRRAFPDLFMDFNEIDELDPILREHIRYPMDLFSAQADIYLRYHMQDPEVFFTREDLWAHAQEVFFENIQDVEPYYVIMKLPGEDKEEFVLLLPFTPGGEERKNMVGWMAARNDPGQGEDLGNYGKLVTFNFPKDSQVDGPEQIEARITSDETIGRELSLLCPEGKQCIRGNLLAIPMSGPTGISSLLYVEPLYIQAEALALPELKKVIVADENRVIMSDTLSESLSLLVGKRISVTAVEPDPTDGTGGEPGTTVEVPDQALRDAQEEISNIQTALDELGQSLDDLQKALEKIAETPTGGNSQ